MVYHVKGLEYLDHDVKIRGVVREGIKAKRFVTLDKTEKLPSEDDIKKLAKDFDGDVRKAWVMEFQGNKWSKAMDTIDIESEPETAEA